jgi:photosystem II stability/assembly factor-like uncharacterized protein
MGGFRVLSVRSSAAWLVPGWTSLCIVAAAGARTAVAPQPAAPPATAAPAPSDTTPASPVVRPLTEEDLRGLAWRSVGPANMGGRVAAIALVPGSRTSFYVGFGTGGLWKTENLGVTFAPVFDETGVASIGAVAVADAPPEWRGWKSEEPSAAAAAPRANDTARRKVHPDSLRADRRRRGKGKIVWVGTGEGNGRNSSSWGRGVYRSTDGGARFVHVGLEDSADIPRLAVDPHDPDVCWVAALGHLWGPNAERGLYKTTDGGATWRRVLGSDDRLGCCDVVLDPQHPDVAYAAMYARRRTPWSFQGTSEDGGIFKSEDGGKTWRKLTAGLPPRTGRIGLTVVERDPRILYAAVESDWGGTGRDPFEDRSPSGGLFRSEDRGATWKRVSELSFRPFYFSRVAVDPRDDRRVYLPGWDLGVSDDGGRTFRRSGSENVHVDFHAIAVNAEDPNQILVGNDGGVYVSHDRARTWDHLAPIAVGQFYRVAVDDADPYRIGGGLQDNGSWIGPSETLLQTMDAGKDGILSCDWRMIFFGDGFGVAFDPTDPNRVYATSQGGHLARIRLDTNVQRLLRPTPREGQERLRFNWNAPFLLSRHDPTVLYQGGNKVFRLTQRGDLWFPASPDLSRGEPDKTATVGSDAETYGTVTALDESPLQKGRLWAGTDDGRVHVTTDDGKTWTDVTPAAAGGLYVARVVASRHDAEAAYAAVDGHRSDVYRPLVLATRDRGRSWTEITGDLPVREPVKSLAEDVGNPDVLYAGTEFGIYLTVERGGRWIRLNGKTLPPAPVDDIVMQPRERDLVAGTHGRSIWVLDAAACLAQLGPETRGRDFALLDILPARPRIYAGRAYGAGHGLFRAKNGPRGAVLDFWVRDAAGEPVTITVADSTGFVLRTLTGTSRRGLNRLVWDLRADDKHLFDSLDERELGQTQFVPAGTYTVTAKLGDAKDEKKVQVLQSPGADR